MIAARFTPLALFVFTLLLTPLVVLAAGTPIATDTRMRTFVYGENEVFRIVAKHGFQSNIEFGPREEIETMSIGDSVAWKVTPARDRLFIKALQKDAHTNLTVVTNKRAYQFDLSSKVEREEDLVYVVRFFYPEVDFDSRMRRPSSNSKSFESGALIDASYNFNYSLTGPGDVAPAKVFDDGQFTFFQFPRTTTVPTFFAVDREGNEQPLISRSDGEYVIVERVLPQFSLRSGEAVVCVFNDNVIVPPGAGR